VNKIIKIPSFQLLSTQVVKSKIDPYKLCEWCVESMTEPKNLERGDTIYKNLYIFGSFYKREIN
jgi:hypothetical protein